MSEPVPSFIARIYDRDIVVGDVAYFHDGAYDVIEVVKGGTRLDSTRERDRIWVKYRRRRDGVTIGWCYGGLAGHDMVRVQFPRPEEAKW